MVWTPLADSDDLLASLSHLEHTELLAGQTGGPAHWSDGEALPGPGHAARLPP